MEKWKSLISFVLILLFASAADSIMDTLGPFLFFGIGIAVMGTAWFLLKIGELVDR